MVWIVVVEINAEEHWNIEIENSNVGRNWLQHARQGGEGGYGDARAAARGKSFKMS